MLNRRNLLSAALASSFLFLIPAGAAAQTDPVGRAQQFINDLGEDAIDVLANRDLSTEEIERQFRDLLNRGFDVDYIGRFVLGQYWNQATEEQWAALEKTLGAADVMISTAALVFVGCDTVETADEVDHLRR